MEVSARLALPSLTASSRQDEYGRDVLSRIIWGARASLTVAFVSAMLAGIIGITLGLLGGYARGLVEILTVRSMEAIVLFPRDPARRRMGTMRVPRSRASRSAGNRRRLHRPHGQYLDEAARVTAEQAERDADDAASMAETEGDRGEARAPR